MSDWQPIETAPKDGAIILATWEDSWTAVRGRVCPHAEAMYWDDGWFYAYDGDSHPRPPSHWMPIQAPTDKR